MRINPTTKYGPFATHRERGMVADLLYKSPKYGLFATRLTTKINDI